MPKPLLLLAVAVSLSSLTAQAQYIVAGSTTNARYINLRPNKVLAGQRPGVNQSTDSLDLDGDGRFDLQLTAVVSTVNFPSYAEAQVHPRHDDVALYSSSQAPALVAFAAADTIQARGPQPASSLPPNTWGSRSTIYPYGPSWLVRLNNNPAGNQSYGMWLGGQDHYLGLRLRAGGSWRYGWLRLLVQTTGTDRLIIIIKDYALGNAVLAAAAAPSQPWQVHPTPTHDWLRIDLPPTATLRQLRLLDVCGRPVLTPAQLPADARLDLRALPAGTYLLHGQLTDGRQLTRRIVKQ
ncbi:T9SS type A sorting domain-containing protein [Hymenobacter sp. ASUV-10]|uniref:T9SS type A sorting domain-containing protein n=1 Tax=Hymenobacter aranciens TaxID=3063996 RepID=A0ABT9BAJ0_9BACT|nr:T9SS type A sorting domain-containing protein [Hymenobacter sp. ASUV-10]MDO7874047.1 T9SS type A sorting domain-containing protein [Hymenobacter sp. ASUV-10]